MAETPILLTGATGWLGRRIVRALTDGCAEMGAEGRGGRAVRILATPSDDVADLVDKAEIVIGDVRDPAAADALTAQAEGGTLIHLAGVTHRCKRTREFANVNVEGTATIVQASIAAGLRRLIAMSSDSPIGASRNPNEVFDEDSPYNPRMDYGRSKRAMEEWLTTNLGQSGTPERTIIRAPWFYGPGQPKRQTRLFSLIKHGRFSLVGGGASRRSMGYVDSLASGILLAVDSPEIVDTARTVLREDFSLSVNPRTLRLPGIISDLARLADRALQETGRYKQEIHELSEMNLTIAGSIARAKKELGYRPLVELREGMRRSVASALERGDQI